MGFKLTVIDVTCAFLFRFDGVGVVESRICFQATARSEARSLHTDNEDVLYSQ